LAIFHLTEKAEQDLLGIGDYTLQEWGEVQADRYLDSLQNCFQLLADRPPMGRLYPRRPGLRRYEHDKHVVFYRQTDLGIKITRILHQRMLPDAHDLDSSH
jgi:toxin ParE1/3/4